MRYQGSKRRFMKEIAPILEKHISTHTKFYDLFGGGMNVVSAIDSKYEKVANEFNFYVCSMWKHIQKNVIMYGIERCMDGLPNNVSETTYYNAKDAYLNNDTSVFPAYLIGFIGSACSYGGGWFNGYARFNPNKNEDHIKEAWNGIKKQVMEWKGGISNTNFIYGSYENVMIDDEYPQILYCDIPYEATKKYENDFDHKAFWEWAEKMAKKGHYVYVSEYTAPSTWDCLWEKVKKDGMGTTKEGNKQKIKTEKIFIYHGKIY